MTTPPTTPAKGPFFVIGPDQGRSHWMPDPGLGYTTTIVCPWDFPMLSYSMGIQTLLPGEILPEHYHDRHEELFYIFEGEGSATIDGKPFRVGKGMTLFFGRNISHTLTNDGARPMTWVWVFNPPGLEHVLSGIGAERTPGQERPARVPRNPEPSPVVSVVTKRGRPPAAIGGGHD